jgi:opacity protein-like surface antigen
MTFPLVRPLWPACFVVLTLTGFASTASAAGAVDADGNFPAGLWSLTLIGGYLNELGPHDQEYAGGAVGVNCYVLENLSLGAEFGAWTINQPVNDAFAWSAGVGLRHHFLTWDDGSVFFDVGEYAMQADTDVPDDGTSFNYLFLCGGGVTYRLSGNIHLMAGARYFHLSNAGREGGDSNPSNNGVQGFTGVMFTF